MKAAALVLLAILAVACGGDGEPGTPDAGGADGAGDDTSDGGDDASDASDDGGDDGEPAELAGILAAHNEVRAAHGVAPLTWNPQLAVIARDWAAGCRDQDDPVGLIDHNPGRSDAYGSYVGENVYGSSGPTDGPAAVESWAAEESDYDHESNTCSGICGHYTQIVWAGTTSLGCGLHACDGLTYGHTIVCDYAPGGNDGGRPY